MLLSPVDTVVFSWPPGFKDQFDEPTKGQEPPMQMVWFRAGCVYAIKRKVDSLAKNAGLR